MIDGSAWNARIKPIEPGYPGGCARGPKRKRIPSNAPSMTCIVTSLRTRKNFDPNGTRKTKRANKTCSAIPQMITRRLTLRLDRENRTRKPMKQNTPTAETPLYSVMPVPKKFQFFT